MGFIDNGLIHYAVNTNKSWTYFLTSFLNGGTTAAEDATVCVRKRLRMMVSSSAPDIALNDGYLRVE